MDKYVKGAARSLSPIYNKTAHGYTGGEIIYRKSDSTFDLAKADVGTTAEVLGVVVQTEGTDRFALCLEGEISLVAANFQEGTLTGLVDGSTLFLSASSAGKFTWTEPSVVGQISKPLVTVTSINGTIVKGVFQNMRGSTVGGTNLTTSIGLLLNGTPKTIQNVSGYPIGGGGKINGTITVLGPSPIQGCRVEISFQKISASVYNISAAFPASSIIAASGALSASVTTGGDIQITLPTITGATSASITFSIDASSVGTTLPLSIDARLVLGNTSGTAVPAGAIGEKINFSTASGITISSHPTTIGNGSTTGVATLTPGVYLVFVTGIWIKSDSTTYIPTELYAISGTAAITNLTPVQAQSADDDASTLVSSFTRFAYVLVSTTALLGVRTASVSGGTAASAAVSAGSAIRIG
jgi:hypothetical protein